jgi:hypothetical protein
MIDIEPQVYAKVLAGVTPTLAEMGINDAPRHVCNEYVNAPAVFPHISITEIGNTSDPGTRSTSDTEEYAAVTYQVEICSNKRNGRKAECKRLAAAIDEVLLGLGFTRKSLDSFPNLLDATVYRIVGRYTALVSKDEVLYRR